MGVDVVLVCFCVRVACCITRVMCEVSRYVEHDALIWEYLNSSIHLAPYLDKKFNKIYAGASYQFYRQRWALCNLNLELE